MSQIYILNEETHSLYARSEYHTQLANTSSTKSSISWLDGEGISFCYITGIDGYLSCGPRVVPGLKDDMIPDVFWDD